MSKEEQNEYCAFCDKREMLKEFKGIYICKECIEAVKNGDYKKEEKTS